MTKEEAIFCEKSYIGETNCTDCKYYIADTCLSRESHKMAIKALEQDNILDKIKAEIENMRIVYDKSPNYEDDRTDEEKAVDWFNMDKILFLEIIDKYKAESEGKE